MKYLITIFLFIVPFIAEAQNRIHEKSIFISGGIGVIQSSSSEELTSKFLPSVLFQIGFGIPINHQLTIYNRISYTSKSDFKSYARIEPINQLVEATSSFSQLIYNGGLRYSIYLAQDWNIGFSAGFTYSLVNNKSSLKGELYQKLDNQNLYGYFGGIDLEHRFSDSQFSAFGEAFYNYIRNDNIYFRDKFSGMNLTAGVRFYLQK
ncbi:MAG: DUF2787 family protein [Ignavibacteriaceae bacterium]|jgi:hypothetical protein